jgi:DNA-binding transcriptional LysR family regulator
MFMHFNNTNWNLYKPFMAVYEVKNLYAASEILGVSRAAISKNIKELGDQLGVTLFTVTPKGFVPTASGRALHESIKNICTLIVGAEDELQEFDGGTYATIKIGVQSAVAEMVLANHLTKFCARYPNVRLEFFTHNILEMLAQGKLDFVVSLGQYLGNTDFKQKHITTVNLTFIASRQFVLAKNVKLKISLQQFLDLPIIAYNETFDEFIAANKIVVPYDIRIIKTQSSEFNFRLVRGGIGVGLYCKELLPLDDKNIVEMTVEGVKLPTSDVVFVYSSALTPAARAFFDGLVTGALK